MLLLSLFSLSLAQSLCDPSATNPYAGRTFSIKKTLDFNAQKEPIGAISGNLIVNNVCSFTVKDFVFTPSPEHLSFWYGSDGNGTESQGMKLVKGRIPQMNGQELSFQVDSLKGLDEFNYLKIFDELQNIVVAEVELGGGANAKSGAVVAAVGWIGLLFSLFA